ncbi:MAG: hypothetical protein PHF29_07970 [Candidatus Riflebacteria bacterium]|nr:hypothetical protein [Candidatus Riflebacteria bacterium]
MKQSVFNSKRRAMAILVVICLSTVILMLGMVYMKTYTDSAPASKLQLDRVQADFLAKGIQNIALLKIKKYPDFFIRSYRQHIYQKRVLTEGLPDLKPEQKTLPTPFELFMGRNPMSGDYDGVLNNLDDNDFFSPVEVASYSTDIAILSSQDFTKDFFEVTVHVQLKGKKAINTYKTSVAASKVPQ